MAAHIQKELGLVYVAIRAGQSAKSLAIWPATCLRASTFYVFKIRARRGLLLLHAYN